MTLVKIDLDYLSRTLAALLEIPSPTGYTDEISRHVGGEIERLGYRYELTRRGVIRARLPGRHHVGGRAIVSHLDTLGAQVKRLKENGRLELVPIGNWSSRFAEGARATVFTNKGTYRGTILPLKASGHTFHDEVDTQPVAWTQVELRVDAFCRNPRDAERLGIEVGDIVGIDPQPEFLDNGFIVSRHLDDKAGAAVMLAAMKALAEKGTEPPVDVYWLFTISEEVGHGASSVLTPDIASLVAVDNGTSAPGQNSSEFGVTVAMADQSGPFDWHLTGKLVRLCQDHDIRYRKDVFRYYRSDAAAAIEGGADVRHALIAFGIDASHGYERIHMHALRSLAELIGVYVESEVEITRDMSITAGLGGFTHQPMEEAEQTLSPAAEPRNG